jgi:hypothetical protein
MKRLWTVVAAIASVAALVAVPAAYAAYTSAKFEVTQAGTTTTIKLTVDPNDDPTAILQIILPTDTQVTTNQAPGTALGRATAVVKALDLGGADLALEGEVLVAAPGQVSAAVRTACIADTPVAATWVLALSAGEQQLAVPVYFVTWPSPYLNIYICFGPPDVPVGTPRRAPFGAKPYSLEATFAGVFRTFSAGAWIGHFSPYTPLVGVENWTGGVASPAAVGPGAVTLTARRAGAGANLVGRVTQMGAGRSDATVTIVGGSASGKLRSLGTATVAADGTFTFRARAGTFFRARAVAAPGPAPWVCQRIPSPTDRCVNPTANGFTAQSRVVRKR